MGDKVMKRVSPIINCFMISTFGIHKNTRFLPLLSVLVKHTNTHRLSFFSVTQTRTISLSVSSKKPSLSLSLSHFLIPSLPVTLDTPRWTFQSISQTLKFIQSFKSLRTFLFGPTTVSFLLFQ